MIRWWLVPVVCLLAAANADAGVKKCVDAQGNVTFTDRPCPSNSKQQDVEVQADAADESVGETSSGTSSSDRANRFARQVDRLTEQLEAKRRDFDARCSRGDKEACANATCMLVATEGASAERYRDCARANGHKFTSRWAQMSDVRVSNGRTTRVAVVCLQHPEVMRGLGGREVRIFNSLELQAENHATGFHDRDRFYTNMLGGPDFATWEEAADTMCDPVAAAKANKSVKDKLR